MPAFASTPTPSPRHIVFVAAVLAFGFARTGFAQTAPETPAYPGPDATDPPYQFYPPYQPYEPYPGYPEYEPYPPYPPDLQSPTQPTPDYAAWPGQPEPLRVETPAKPTDHGSGRFSFGAALGTSVVSEQRSTSAVFAPLLEGALALHRTVLLRATWGFAWSVDGQGLGQSTTRSGNPIVAGAFATQRGAWRLLALAGVTAPLAHVPRGTDGRLYAFTYNHTMATWGMWNQWLWVPEHMAIPAGVRFDYHVDGHAVIIEAAEATLIGVRGGASGVKTVGQLALEARLRVGADVTLCPRWQTVRLPSGGVDLWQSALGLRLGLSTSAGNFFAGALLNLDEPLGVFGDLGRWGIHLGKEIDP